MDPAAAVSKTIEASPRVESARTEPVGASRGEGEFPRALDDQVEAAARRTVQERSQNARSDRANGAGAGSTRRAKPKQASEATGLAQEEAGSPGSDAATQAPTDLESEVASELAAVPVQEADATSEPGQQRAAPLDPETDADPKPADAATKDPATAPEKDLPDDGSMQAALVGSVAASVNALAHPAHRALHAATPGERNRRVLPEREPGTHPASDAGRHPEIASSADARPPTTPLPEASAPQTARNDSVTPNYSVQDRQPSQHAGLEAPAVAPPSSGDSSPAQTSPASPPPIQPAIPGAGGPNTAAATAPASGDRSLPELPVRNETEIVQTARVLAHQHGGEARIVLHPPQLGELGVRLIVTHDVAHLSLTAEHGAVAHLLARHLPELRASLEAHNIQLDRVDVDVRGDTDGGFGRAPERGVSDGGEGDRPGARGRLRSGLRAAGGVLPSLRGTASRWAHLGTVDLRI